MHSEIRIILALVLAIAAISIASADDRFHLPGTAYSAIFPGAPECEVGNVRTPAGSIERHVCAYYDKKLGGGYSMEYVPLPLNPHASNAQLILRSAAAGAAHESQSEITHEAGIQFEDFPALEVAFLKREQGSLAHVLYVLVERDLLTMSVDGGSRMHESPKAAAFLNSLRVSSPSSVSP